MRQALKDTLSIQPSSTHHSVPETDLHESHPWSGIFTFLAYLLIGFIVGFWVGMVFGAVAPVLITWGLALVLGWRAARRAWRGG